jgi:tripartite-type tricarboxylate transporter receptor subunit TctC
MRRHRRGPACKARSGAVGISAASAPGAIEAPAADSGRSTMVERLVKAFRNALMVGMALASPASPALAQGYPSKPVRLVVPLAAGGVTDIAARMLAAKLAERLGQPVVVENKTGAAQAIGSEFVARAPADGYTLIMGTISSHAINASLYRNLRYSITRDFVPVSLVTSQPLMLVVHPSVPANTVAELIQLLKANPGKYSFGSPGGAGTSGHLTAEMFKLKTGTSMVHIPYKGSGPMIIDLVGGQIHLAFDNMPTALAQVKAGKLRGLAVTSAERFKLVPDMPTLNETVPGFDVTAWQGLFAPAATPQAILDRLAAEVQQIMRMPDIVSRSNEMGVTAVGSSQSEFAAFVKGEVERWAEVVRISGARADE